jgi:hypothetical protein
MSDRDTVIALISDMQVGSTVALCPPKWQLYDGGTHTASPGQRIIHRKWVDSAKNVKDLLTETRRRKRLVIVLNGEPIDGHHHDTPQLITKTPNEQIEMAITLLDEWMQIAEYEPKRGDSMYLVRGTDAHEKGEHIERIGRDFDGVVPYRRDSSPLTKDGRYHYQKLRRKVNGQLFQIAHHGFGRGTRAWTKENSIAYALKSMYFTCLDSKQPIPSVVVASHYHVFTQVYYYGKQKTIYGCITPSWQLRTNFVHRIAALENINTIGNLYFDVTKSGAIKPIPDVIEIEETPIEEF